MKTWLIRFNRCIIIHMKSGASRGWLTGPHFHSDMVKVYVDISGYRILLLLLLLRPPRS